jgi:hypothetical protein
MIIFKACTKLILNYQYVYEDYVGLEVLTAVIMKSSIFWNIAPCSPLKVNRHFGGTCRPACYLLHVGFLFGLFFDSEDRADMFLQNVG